MGQPGGWCGAGPHVAAAGKSGIYLVIGVCSWKRALFGLQHITVLFLLPWIEMACNCKRTNRKQPAAVELMMFAFA